MENIKQNIIDSLKVIKYPGFNRDIVSFGIIKDITINNNQISFLLNISTDNPEHKSEIKNNIENLMKSNFNFSKIEILFSDKSNINSNNNNLKIKKIIAFASCKGGVGKSTISLNVACELAKTHKVGFLDLDIYGPSLPIMINSKKQPILENKKLIPIEKFGVKFMSFGFINNENNPTIWRGPMVSRLTQQFFENVEWGDLDFLILDLPPGTGDIQLTLVQKIALYGAVIITTPQDLSLVDVKKGSDMFKKVNAPVLGVIENMSEYRINGYIQDFDKNSKVKLYINDDENINIDEDGKFIIRLNIFEGLGGELESKRLDVPLLGKINMDPLLSLSSDKGIPYVLTESEKYNYLEFKKIVERIISI